MVGNAENIIGYLFKQDREKLFEIKEHKKRRSLNANNYAWELITKIANSLRKSKEEVYLEMLQSYGQSEMISVKSEVDMSGYLKYYSLVGTSELNGTLFNHYRVYKGSSEYDTKEMSILLDGIIQEAKQLDIDTMTPDQIAELKSLWNNQ